jgi:phosphopantetheinyl transferase
MSADDLAAWHFHVFSSNKHNEFERLSKDDDIRHFYNLLYGVIYS